MFFALLAIAIIAFAFWIYKYGTKNDDFFKNYQIPSLKPKFLVGNTSDLFMQKLSQADFIQKVYDSHPNAKAVGLLDFRLPTILIRDPELIKKIAIKEFDHFLDHRVFIDASSDPMFGKNLVALQGHEWKIMRTTLSPAFTGSKMRLMFDLASKCGQQINEYVIKETKSNSNYVIEMRDFFSRFTNDIIATCAFGIEVNSMVNRDNDFYNMGSRVLSFGTLKSRMKLLGYFTVPKLMAALKIKFLNDKDEKFFRDTILETMDYREKNNIIRPDMINLLLNVKKGKIGQTVEKEDKEFSVVDEHDLGKLKKTDWTDDELVAQCLIFFAAGFDTVSTAMSFVAYELALNPDIQSKLLEEVDQIKENLNGQLLNYDSLQKMKYLDMIVSETLRKWPPGPVMDRMCKSDITIEQDGVSIDFKAGTQIWFPAYPIHRDAKYFPNPEKFDPERFSDERKHEINPLTYFPFGNGPRNCIGSRFALMELKAVLYYILLNCTFEVSEKTQIPIKFGAKSFRMIPDDGLWIKLAARKF